MDTWFKVYSQLFYALTTPPQNELQGYLLNLSDLNISQNDFSFVFQISVKICINICLRTEVDKQEKRIHF